MRNEIEMTDEQIEEAFDEYGIGLVVNSLVFTRDTIADFAAARQNYAEPGRVEEQTDKTLHVERVQVRKGDARKTLLVIDFGSVRAAYVGG